MLLIGLAALPAPLSAGAIDERLASVAQTIDEADDMFRAAMKGHLPSLEAINALRARLELAQNLYKGAESEAAEGKENQADAKLDAAEFLARHVFEAADH